MESYFLSDLHLKSINERRGQILLRFLSSLLSKDPGRIFFLGDIFDLWVSDHQVFKDKFADILRHVEILKSKGWEIYFFEGNHDLHIHPYWRDELGAKVYTDFQIMNLDGIKIRLEHGDLINLEDKAYLRLRKVLRHPIIETLGHKIPGQFWVKLGETWSGFSRRKSMVYQTINSSEIIKMIRHHAHRVYNHESFDAIITGHMHVRDDYEFEVSGSKVRSINLGSWFDETKVLKLSNKNFQWIELE